jgi:UDP-3-O-[3-hydroxymyristoyl] glucosamine N-acyltransferase
MRFRTAVTAGDVAGLVDGELRGTSERLLAGLAAISVAGPGELAFAAGPRVGSLIRATRAGAVLVPSELADLVPADTAGIVVSAPAAAVARVIAAFGANAAEQTWGIHPTAELGRDCRWSGRVRIGAAVSIGPDVQLGADCVVEYGAVIGAGVHIGDRCRIGPHAAVDSGTQLGADVWIRPGARVGGPGFGFVEEDGTPRRVPHLGRCILEDDVEVGANSTVDAGASRDTIIGAGTKIDNLVQIAHNVRIGRGCIIMAQVGIAGSTVVEDGVMLAGQAGLADHLTVGRDSRVASQSGVIGDVPAGSTVSGYPARDHRSVLRQTAAVQRLAPLVSSLERIAKRDES